MSNWEWKNADAVLVPSSGYNIEAKYCEDSREIIGVIGRCIRWSDLLLNLRWGLLLLLLYSSKDTRTNIHDENNCFVSFKRVY
jgi:hypothetical protein